MEYNEQLRRKFKWDARQSIRAKFWPTMGVSLLLMIPTGLISIIYQYQIPSSEELTYLPLSVMMPKILLALGLFLLAVLFICVPLEFGAKRYFVARARNQEVPVGMVFSCFGDGKSYVTSLKLAIAIFVRSLGWIALEIAGCVVLVIAGVFAEINSLLLAITAIAICALSLWINVKIRRYDGAYIRLIDDPEMSAWQAVKECARTFYNHNWELFVFDLSFIGWELLTLITLGIAGIYLSAYSEMAFVNYFDALRCNELSR